MDGLVIEDIVAETVGAMVWYPAYSHISSQIEPVRVSVCLYWRYRGLRLHSDRPTGTE